MLHFCYIFAQRILIVSIFPSCAKKPLFLIVVCPSCLYNALHADQTVSRSAADIHVRLIRSSLLWQWLLLAIAAPFLAFPTPARTPALILILALWGSAWLTEQEPFPRTPLSPALLLLSLMVLISMWTTYAIQQSLPKIAGIVLGLGAFSILARHRARPGLWWLGVFAFLAAGVAIAGVSLVSTRWTAKIALLTPIMNRLPGPLLSLPGAADAINPNEVGGAMTWVAPPALAVAALVLAKWPALRAKLGTIRGLFVTVGAVLAACIALVTLILAQSRSAYLGCGVAGILMCLFILPRRGRIALSAMIVIAFIGTGVVLWSSGPAAMIHPLFAQSGDPLSSLDGRLEIWSRALYGIHDFALTGMGMNTFREVVHRLYPLSLISPNTDIAHAHNEFLQAALDLGVPGLVAFVALYAGAFGMLASIWRTADQLTTTDPLFDRVTIRSSVLGLGGGLLAHAVYGMTDAVALGAKPGILYWMLLGLVAGLYRQSTLQRVRRAGVKRND